MGPLGPALRRARLPGGGAELPGHVRLRGRVRPDAQRAGRRPGHARVGGGPALVRRPPRHVGRELPRHDAVGGGGGRARTSSRRSASRSPRRTSATRSSTPAAPSRSRRRWPGCTRSSTRSSGWRTVLRTRAAARPSVVATPATSCPWASATPPPSASPSPSTRTGSSTAHPGDPWWDGVDFGRRLDKVPPASLDRRAGTTSSCRPRWPTTRRSGDAGRPARLTIGPWTHASPGLFAETVRDGPRVVRRAARRADPGTRAPGAPVRVFVMGSRTWQEFSMWPPAGETERWYLGRWGTLGTDAAGRRARPTATTTTRTTRRPSVGGPVAQHAARRGARSSAGASTGTTCSPTPARC